MFDQDWIALCPLATAFDQPRQPLQCGRLTGGELVHVDPRIVAGAKQQAAAATKGLGAGLTWPGLLRRLDRRSPGYDN